MGHSENTEIFSVKRCMYGTIHDVFDLKDSEYLHSLTGSAFVGQRLWERLVFGSIGAAVCGREKGVFLKSAGIYFSFRRH